MAICRIGALLYKALQADYSIRWGYKIINSRSEPHAFETVYKSVAGYADAEFPSGSPLQKGRAVGPGKVTPVAFCHCSGLSHRCSELGPTGGQDLEPISWENTTMFLAVLRRLTEPAILRALATPCPGRKAFLAPQGTQQCPRSVRHKQHMASYKRLQCRTWSRVPRCWAPALHPKVLCSVGNILRLHQHIG